jgi:hypothetical protein
MSEHWSDQLAGNLRARQQVWDSSKIPYRVKSPSGGVVTDESTMSAIEEIHEKVVQREP